MKLSRSLLCGLTVLNLSLEGAAGVSVVERPDSVTPNRHHVGNRAPLRASPLIKLPLTAIRPEGWVRQQLELQSAGFHGHLAEVSRYVRKANNAWLDPRGRGDHGWEEVPYWLKGFGDCAYLLGHTAQIAEAKVWIEGALASQQPDGWFGPGEERTGEATELKGREDLWPNMIMLICLQSYYEYSGDPRVIEMMRRYFQYLLRLPEEKFIVGYWATSRAADNLWSVHWLYNRTGEPWLLELAAKIHRRTARWTETIPNWHNVNMAQGFGGPTFFWPQSGDPLHLFASERNWQMMRALYGQVPGGLFGGDENCRPGFGDPRQAVETCGMVEIMYSHERLLNVTGNPLWADRCEEVAFNSLPAALTADFKALRYLTSPNLVLSDRHNKAPGLQNGGPMFHLNPHDHRCCQHNFGHGWPYFVEHLWMATPGNGLAATLYAASTVTAKVGEGVEVTIAEKTHYPFAEAITLTLTTPSPVTFPLYLRIPEWCAAPVLKINGIREDVVGRPLSYLRIERSWASGDTVVLELPMAVRLRTWVQNQDSVSVDRGPLTYSLKIGEEYVRAGGTDTWPAWEIHPTTPWNYGLALDGRDPAGSFHVTRKAWPADDRPFAPGAAPIELTVQGRRIPEWQADRLGLVGLLQPSPARTTEPLETLTLVPMGSARLRISAFPTVTADSAARAWVAAPRPKPSPYRLKASHCFASDSLEAIADGLEPANSGDATIPRLTWWDHRGTQEWIECDFGQSRRVGRAAVYWFDDTGVGQCRVPASWRLRFKTEDGEWKTVENADGYGVVRDAWNAVRFAGVTTTGLRLEVELQPGYSAGILECQIE